MFREHNQSMDFFLFFNLQRIGYNSDKKNILALLLDKRREAIEYK